MVSPCFVSREWVFHTRSQPGLDNPLECPAEWLLVKHDLRLDWLQGTGGRVTTEHTMMAVERDRERKLFKQQHPFITINTLQGFQSRGICDTVSWINYKLNNQCNIYRISLQNELILYYTIVILYVYKWIKKFPNINKNRNNAKLFDKEKKCKIKLHFYKINLFETVLIF